MSKRDYRFANYCLERWARWALDVNGYPERSPILKLGETSAHLSMSTIPTGVEPRCREVELANRILAMMKHSCGKSANRADLIKRVVILRENSESLEDVLKKIEERRTRYYDALDEFTIRLESIIENKS